MLCLLLLSFVSFYLRQVGLLHLLSLLKYFVLTLGDYLEEHMVKSYLGHVDLSGAEHRTTKSRSRVGFGVWVSGLGFKAWLTS